MELLVYITYKNVGRSASLVRCLPAGRDCAARGGSDEVYASGPVCRVLVVDGAAEGFRVLS